MIIVRVISRNKNAVHLEAHFPKGKKRYEACLTATREISPKPALHILATTPQLNGSKINSHGRPTHLPRRILDGMKRYFREHDLYDFGFRLGMFIGDFNVQADQLPYTEPYIDETAQQLLQL